MCLITLYYPVDSYEKAIVVINHWVRIDIERYGRIIESGEHTAELLSDAEIAQLREDGFEVEVFTQVKTRIKVPHDYNPDK